MNRKEVLLATIEAALEMQSPGGPLRAEELGRLGRQLGLDDQRTRELVSQLSDEKRIDLEWGGIVKGVLRESGRPSIFLGENATFVADGAHIHQSAVGAGSKMRISPLHSHTQQEELAPIVAVLTVSLDKLTAELNGMAQAERELCGQLIPLVETVQKQLLSKEGTDKGAVAGKLEGVDKALGLIEKVGKLGTVAAPYLQSLGEALHRAAQYLPALPSLPL